MLDDLRVSQNKDAQQVNCICESTAQIMDDRNINREFWMKFLDQASTYVPIHPPTSTNPYLIFMHQITAPTPITSLKRLEIVYKTSMFSSVRLGTGVLWTRVKASCFTIGTGTLALSKCTMAGSMNFHKGSLPSWICKELSEGSPALQFYASLILTEELSSWWKFLWFASSSFAKRPSAINLSSHLNDNGPMLID